MPRYLAPMLALLAAGCIAAAPQHSPSSTSLATRMLASADNRPSRSTEDIGAQVRARQPQLQFCYQEGLARNPDLAGSATVAINIAGDGRITEVEIVSRSWQGPGVSETESCIRGMVARWVFPASEVRESLHSFLLSFTR